MSTFQKILIILMVFFIFIKMNLDNTENEIPLVSIIIPVHNNFNYTYNCIFSILKSEISVPYEIIISNDLSTDETKFLKQKYFNNYTNIFVYNNNNNKNKIYNFLLNCNQAVKFARGKYIVFLNNDTKVQKHWLTFLLEMIEKDNKIGLVGSKLIHPKGKLQEAGGIVWRNGLTSKFGDGKNPELPEFNYAKEVDYISGASIIIRRSVWNKIGGFDQRFAPAYYEDTDLAFKLRKFGYKVMYQPKSVVIHYLGISNGKSVTNGIKRYLIINHKKFKEKWKNELKYQPKKGNDIFLARDRGFNKSRILVISSFMQKYDKYVWPKSCFMYLNMLKKIGYQPTFLVDNLKKKESYILDLQQMGIEVLYGEQYENNKFEIWLKNNLKYFKFVYLQGYNIAKKYIDFIRKTFNGKIFFFLNNFHYANQITYYKDVSIKKNNFNNELEKNLAEIMNKVDIVHTFGYNENRILKKIFANKIIRNIPIYIYENLDNKIERDFSKRKDLIFVGSFSRPSNTDAVLWFSKEIYPKIIEKYPDIIWHIVGTDIPSEIIILESKNIKIEGNLSEKNLYTLYQRCRIAIVPLRFGAGIKAKVIEAAYNQIPIVTTSIGAEGLDISKDIFILEDNTEKMAEIINKIYIDFSKLKQISNSQKIFIEKYFSFEKAKEIFLYDLNNTNL